MLSLCSVFCIERLSAQCYTWITHNISRVTGFHYQLRVKTKSDDLSIYKYRNSIHLYGSNARFHMAWSRKNIKELRVEWNFRESIHSRSIIFLRWVNIDKLCLFSATIWHFFYRWIYVRYKQIYYILFIIIIVVKLILRYFYSSIVFS